MTLRHLAQLLQAVVAHAYFFVFLRRWTRFMARPRGFYGVMAVLGAVVLALELERVVAHAEPPTWVMQGYGPLMLWSAVLTQALPFVIALDVALRWRERRRPAEAPAPDSEEEPEFAGEEADRAVQDHLLRVRSSRSQHGASAAPVAVTPPAPEPIDAGRRRSIAQLGTGAAFAAFGAPLLWGVVKTRLDVEVVELPIRIARLPRVLDGFSIVQVSDIHIGPFLGARELAHAEELVAGLRPDLVVMTGDLVHLRRADVPPAAAWLARLVARARHGVTAITGNHEYYVGRDLVFGAMRAAGARVLFNEGCVVAPNDGGGIALVGTDDYAGAKSGEGVGPEVQAPLLGLPPDAPRVLLCHQPQYFETAASYGFDLQLSGHTHGGQIAPFGGPAVKAIFGYVSGLYAIGDARLYVNRGLGTSGPPSRVRVRPEITKIVLVAG
jgi:hypothetical protein